MIIGWIDKDRLSVSPYRYVIHHISVSILADLVGVAWMPVPNSFESARAGISKGVYLHLTPCSVWHLFTWVTQVLHVCFWRSRKRWSSCIGRLRRGKLKTNQVGLGILSQERRHTLRPCRSHGWPHCAEELTKS